MDISVCDSCGRIRTDLALWANNGLYMQLCEDCEKQLTSRKAKIMKIFRSEKFRDKVKETISRELQEEEDDEK